MKQTRFNRATAGLLAASVGLCFIGSAMGQADQPSLDELLDLSPSQPTTNDSDHEKPATAEPDRGLNESVERALSASDAADVFEQVIDEMDRVSRRLGRAFDPGVQTQRMQESILRRLDKVIESAKQQSSSGGGGSGQPKDQDRGSDELAQQKPSAGGGQAQAQPGGSQASTGAAGSGSPDKPEAQDTPIEQLRKEWGVLPPRVREELSDGLRERFSPLYRRMTESYYKALAQQE